MLVSIAKVSLLALIFGFGAVFSCAQNADNRTPMPGRGEAEDDRPKSFRETLEKLRIEREKKEFDQMIERGGEVLKISEDLEKAYVKNGRLTEREMSKLATVENLVKKIRGELGGDGDDDDKPNLTDVPLPSEQAVKSFRSTIIKLFDELKKTSRFSISAAAIQSSNAAIKIVRFLRLKN
ncbi:MAG: hypothetical protein WKF34_03545 [Pyrinomonadaceae bacterium]